MFESGSQGILSSIASCLSSRLEHDPDQGIAALVTLNDHARWEGIAEEEIYDLVRLRLLDAGIPFAGEEEEGGCVLGVDIQLDTDGFCCFNLDFFRAHYLQARRSARAPRGGAWRLTFMARAETGGEVKDNLSLLLTEFVRQYMEAN